MRADVNALRYTIFSTENDVPDQADCAPLRWKTRPRHKHVPGLETKAIGLAQTSDL